MKVHHFAGMILIALGGWRSSMGELPRTQLEHDPEKWVPVFRKDHAQIKEIERDDDSKKSHRALGIWGDAAGGRESQFLSVETQERPSERIARDGARHAERK